MELSLLAALHTAVECSSLQMCRVLLTETSIDAEAVNLRYVQMLCRCRTGNCACFELLIETMPFLAV